MLRNKSVVLSLFLAFVLSACGGSDGFNVGNGQQGSTGTTDTSGGDTGGDGGDGSGSVDPSTLSVSTVEIVSGSDSLAADGTSSTTVRAVVKSSDETLIPSKTVTFTTSAGSFLNGTSTAQTNTYGEAEVTLVSSTNLGGAVVTARADGFTGVATVNFVAGTATNVSLSASPSELNFAKASSLQVYVVDSQGHPVSGETVTFSVSTNESGASLDSTQAQTDENGRATVGYTSGGVAGSDVVTVSLANGSNATQTLNVSASAVVLNQLILAEPNNLGSIVADGTSSTVLRATVLDIDSEAVEGVDVSFSTSVGALSASSVTTDSNGFAEVTLTSTTTVDTAQVAASVGGFNQQVTIEFVPDVPSATNSSITSSPASLPADGESETTVTVILADANGNSIEDDTEIRLITTAGTITSDNPSQTTSGRVQFTLVSSSESGVAELSVTEVNGLTGTVSFGSNSDNEAANIILEAAQPGLFVAGVGQTENTTVNISMVEVDGDPINENNWAEGANTARISFVSKPNGGEFLSGVNAAGDVVDTTSTNSIDIVTTNGSAQVNLQAGTLPGVVEIQVEALDQTGNPYTVPVRATLSQVSIASGPAHTLVFSFPRSNAIENLNDADPRVPGFYRRAGGLTVTDRYGNAVPDGTVINLGVTDSLIAAGVTGSISEGGNVLTDANSFLADSTPVDLDDAMVTRSGTERFIQSNDRILIFDAQAEDKSRFVTSVDSTTIGAQSNYLNDQSNLEYAIGASLLGASIAGVDNDTGNLTIGRASTKDGLAQIRFTYPSSINSIGTGSNTDLDTRVQPYYSGRVFLIAQSSDSGATVIDDSRSFGSISGWSVLPSIDKISGSSTFEVEVRDGGDEVNLPFVDVSTVVFHDTIGKQDWCRVSAVTDYTVANRADCVAAGYVYTGGSCTDAAYTNFTTCEANGEQWTLGFCDDIISSEADCDSYGLSWYSSAGICIDRFATTDETCEDVRNRSSLELTSQFSVAAYVGEDDAAISTGDRIPTNATHTFRVPVDIDTDGDTVEDFFWHPFTDVNGYADVKVVVSGSPFLISGDKATVTVRAGDGTGTVTVEIP